MKPPKVERHSFVCAICNKKRRGDRPWHYRLYGHAWWEFNVGWGSYLGSYRWGSYRGWFEHIECRANRDALWKVLRNLGR